MAVAIPLEPVGKVDVYIDDTVTISLHSPTNDSKAAAAVPLAFHAIGRPLSPEEPISRADLLCLRKLMAEGSLEEVKNTLGWDINTRQFSIGLPNHKFKVWKQSITDIIKTGTATFSQLDTLIGRLTHISVIFPHVLHFLGRLRRLCHAAVKRRRVCLHTIHKEDLALLLLFLETAHKGININLVTFRTPTHVYYSDACPAGLGGYNHQGIAWRWQIPTNLRYRASINMLEHVAATIGPWIDILHKRIPPLSCVLSLTDNTTAAGWLRKSNFSDVGDDQCHMAAKLQTSRSHAARMIKAQIREYSQWFPGKQNIFADSLSRDFHLTDPTLTSLFQSFLPTQTTQRFKIVPLPPKIVCWISAWLQQLPANHLPPEVHQPSKLEHGSGGPTSSLPLIFPTISFSDNYNQKNDSSCSLHSPKRFDEENTLAPEFLDWVKTQSEIPSIMWHRPSGNITCQTQDLTQTASLQDFYKRNTKATKTRIHPQNNKKLSQDRSSSNFTRTKLPNVPVQ